MKEEQNDLYNQEHRPETKTTKKKDQNMLSMLLSGVAGGLIVALFGGGIILSMIDDQEEISQQEVEQQTQETQTTESSAIQATNVAASNSNSLSGIVENVSDAVVGVSNIQQTSLWEESDAEGTGSGVVYKKDGEYAYVVTNNHVVEGAQEVEVILTNGEHVSAELMGTDALTDLAVLRIPSDQVTTVAPIGSSADLQVGDTAIAIGNPLGTEFAGSVTKGIISGLDRAVDVDLNNDRRADWTTEVIQTDAAINPGNSGGALINEQGEVIGINSMKIALGAVEGIGFAIPIDDAKPVIEQLETEGEVTRPFIGISAVNLDTVPARHKQDTLNLSEDVEEGLVVAQVETGSPADSAGLQKYDVITAIDDQTLSSMLDLKTYLYKETNAGDEVTITFLRNGEEQTTTLTLSEQGNL
ncbi:S1C family serine protease [Gracilibacillus sp. YIM 98692]|uniref:S1C family serine protease n=1 Tax=Gracilibacillus sp. YIM 98692 TaxID=2663532 RepID=UPI0013D7F55A|nr:S1C family serine protease [Gracilibacillus sp. YIM 98692]